MRSSYLVAYSKDKSYSNRGWSHTIHWDDPKQSYEVLTTSKWPTYEGSTLWGAHNFKKRVITSFGNVIFLL